jgi:small Trp-rich protein
MIFVIIGTLIIVTNLADIGPFASWNWQISGDLWKFCVPFAFAALWWTWADKSGLNRRKEIIKMDERKAARRKENLVTLGLDEKGRRKGTKR